MNQKLIGMDERWTLNITAGCILGHNVNQAVEEQRRKDCKAALVLCMEPRELGRAAAQSACNSRKADLWHDHLCSRAYCSPSGTH